MAKYRKKPVVIEAERWERNGDHPAVTLLALTEGVRDSECCRCGNLMSDHGRISTLEGPYMVCPGDFIITGVEGEHYACKPEIFRETYEPA